MAWQNPAKSYQAGTKRSAADLDGIPDEQAPPPRPSMPVVYKDDNFLVVNKPWDVRMDGEHEVTVESLALAWLASVGTPAASCHVPGWKQGAVAGAAATTKGDGGGQDPTAAAGVPAATPGAGKAAEGGDAAGAQRPYVHNAGMRGVDSGPAVPQLRFVHRHT